MRETTPSIEFRGLPGPIPTVATAPVPFSEFAAHDIPQLATYREMLNEDVEKLFHRPERFDLAALSSGSDLVTSASTSNFHDTLLMEKPFLDDIEHVSSKL